jgi:Tfp pilus assembly pilus retraction ATPase PilT
LISLTLKDCLIREGLATKSFVSQLPLKNDDELFEYLLESGCVSEQDLHQMLFKNYGYSIATISELVIDSSASTDFQSANNYIVVYESEREIVFALSNPYIQLPIKGATSIKIILIPLHEMKAYFRKEQSSINLASLLDDAISKEVSDIHFFQTEDKGYAVTFRQEGIIKTCYRLNSQLAKTILQQIKLEAHMDLGFHLKPNDGQMTYLSQNKAHSIRVSTIPSCYGEDIALRLYKEKNQCLSFSDLGMSSDVEVHMKQMLAQESGLILVTGPTGSGKTTTLYTMLKYIQSTQNKIVVTLEDPIEKPMTGIRQSSINPAQGYTFAKGLKAVLRQDPDVIMIGEIRDEETAHLALQAAYTGHLVLSTLHTNDVKSSLLRLQSLRCDAFLLSYALRGVISQKLQLDKETLNNFSQPQRRLIQQSLILSKNRVAAHIFEITDMYDLGEFVDQFTTEKQYFYN